MQRQRAWDGQELMNSHPDKAAEGRTEVIRCVVRTNKNAKASRLRIPRRRVERDAALRRVRRGLRAENGARRCQNKREEKSETHRIGNWHRTSALRQSFHALVVRDVLLRRRHRDHLRNGSELEIIELLEV